MEGIGVAHVQLTLCPGGLFQLPGAKMNHRGYIAYKQHHRGVSLAPFT